MPRPADPPGGPGDPAPHRHNFPPSPPRIIYDAHELYPFQYPPGPIRSYWRRIERRTIGRTNLVLTVNESVAAELARLYGVQTVETIYNSCHLQSKSPKADAAAFDRLFRVDGKSLQRRGLRILFHGSLTDGRNLQNLALAIKFLTGRATLYFLGEGPLKDDLERLCRSHILDNVLFAPPVPQRELLGYVAAADLGVIPYNDRHLLNTLLCSPNKLYEFVEAGVPVCASDLPELARFVALHKIGLSGPMSTPRQIAAAIDLCLQAKARGEFTDQSFCQARQRVSWTTQSQKLIDLYDRLGT